MFRDLDDYERHNDFMDSVCNASERMYVREQIDELTELLLTTTAPTERDLLEYKIKQLKDRL